MVLLHFSPPWFYGYDILLEFFFMIISFIVGTFAFYIYRKTKQRSVKYFSIAFYFISLSYLIQTLINIVLFLNMTEKIYCNLTNPFIITLSNLAKITHIFFLIVGLGIILFTTFREDKKRLLTLFILMPLLIIFLSSNLLYMFYLISSIYLAFISWNYILNFVKTKKFKTFLVAVAFLFLFFGSFHFLLSVNHQVFYAIGLFLELLAYILILTNLYLIIKK
ncbi:MAG: hypothetical protein ACOC16_02985 [Nanoarchaeota archaeon]